MPASHWPHCACTVSWRFAEPQSFSERFAIRTAATRSTWQGVPKVPLLRCRATAPESMSVRSSRLAGKPKRATPSSAGKTLPRFHDWRKNCNARSEWTLSLCNPESLNLRLVSTVNACDEIERQGSSVGQWKGQCPFSDIGQCGHAESPPPLIVVLFHHHLHRLRDCGHFGGLFVWGGGRQVYRSNLTKPACSKW